MIVSLETIATLLLSHLLSSSGKTLHSSFVTRAFSTPFHESKALHSKKSPRSQSQSEKKQHVHSVPRIKATDFDARVHYFHERKNTNDVTKNVDLYETPVIIENALTADQCDYICDSIASVSDSIIVDVQRKRIVNRRTKERRTDVYECTMNQAFDLMMGSRHDDSVFAFCESLLDDNLDDEEMANIREILTDAKERLFEEHSEDWFDAFPSSAKPGDCVVMTGEGGVSTLHRDPFEWTGTSLCVEGTKLWRFIAPPQAVNSSQDQNCDGNKSGVQVIDDMLNAYQLTSVAWGDDDDGDGLPLSAGWQSDMTLYDTRDDEIVPSAQVLAEMDDKISTIESIAHDLDALQPNIPHPSLNIWTAVQRPGDLLVIPAYWWHQTYALEPSLAVASQRCGFTERDAPRVINHMLKTTTDAAVANNVIIKDLSVPDILLKNTFHDTDCPQQVADKLFDYLSLIRNNK